MESTQNHRTELGGPSETILSNTLLTQCLKDGFRVRCMYTVTKSESVIQERPNFKFYFTNLTVQLLSGLRFSLCVYLYRIVVKIKRPGLQSA